MRRVWILAAGLVLSACGGGSSKPSIVAGPPLQTIALSEKEFSITPSTISVAKTCAYAFEVTNHGQITHALVIEGNGVEQKSGNIVPGSTTTLTVELSKNGGYEIYCPIDGHRNKGMQANLTVGGSSAGTGGQTTTGTTSSGKGGYGG